MYAATFPSTNGPVQVNFLPGSTTLIAGPNGVGKSALLYQLYRTLGPSAANYLPGHRQIHLNQSLEVLGQDISQLRQNNFNSYDAFNRYKGAWGEDQFKSIIRTLINLENSYNRNFRIEVATHGPSESHRAVLKLSPIDQLNVIFSQSGFLVQFSLSEIGLTANKNGSSYIVEALSDGERAALYIAAAILTQDENVVLLIDEPEKHLHPSITGVLVESSLRMRDSLPVVVSSHDMSLIERLKVDSTIYVKDSSILSLKPEQRQFDVEIISEGDIPEQLRIDVLGARSAIIYVEGTDFSRDSALYSHVYKGWKAISKGSAGTVIESTRGIRDNNGLHWLKVFGIVDGDGRSEHEVAKLASQGVVTLPCPTVENLFFIPEAQRCFVTADLAMQGGIPESERIAALTAAIPGLIAAERENIVARRTLWRVEREMSSQPISVKSIKDGSLAGIHIDTNAIKSDVGSGLQALIDTKDAQSLIQSVPIKNTNIPDSAARILGAPSFKKYCDVIQHQVDIGSDTGIAFIKALKNIMPNINKFHTDADPINDVSPRSESLTTTTVRFALSPPVLRA